MSLKCFILCATLSCTLNVSAGLIISINADEGGSRATMSPTDLAGAPGVRVGNWNNFVGGNRSLPANIQSPNAGNFVYNDGTVVGGSFAVSVTGATGFSNPTAINDAMLYSGFMQNNTDGAQTIFTLTDIPFAQYDIYVYAQGQTVAGANFRGGSVAISESSTTYFTQGGVSPANDGTGYVAMTTTSIPVTPVESDIVFGNYAVYQGLTDTNQTITTTGYLWTDHARQQVYGIQIVEVEAVPEPGTLGLVGISGLIVGLGFLKRRRK